MQRNNIIILTSQSSEPIARGSLRKLCKEFGFPYWTLARLKFPITYKEFTIYKTEFK